MLRLHHDGNAQCRSRTHLQSDCSQSATDVSLFVRFFLSHVTELNLSTPTASIPVPLGSGAVVFNRPCADVLREGGCDNPGDCAALVTTDVTQEPRANDQSIALFANFPDLHLVTANVTWQVHGLAVRFGCVCFFLLSTTVVIRACPVPHDQPHQQVVLGVTPQNRR
jgi:hypothetical protein